MRSRPYRSPVEVRYTATSVFPSPSKVDRLTYEVSIGETSSHAA